MKESFLAAWSRAPRGRRPRARVSGRSWTVLGTAAVLATAALLVSGVGPGQTPGPWSPAGDEAAASAQQSPTQSAAARRGQPDRGGTGSGPHGDGPHRGR
ncbi:hypothetical protein ACG83_19505 [Frankia sp. R43]|uniref:hypothetical protein n=1 Tax=Frankia sp. R43 TaxID=269536 RepID=UPI0006C9ECF8|nr:hypothetical protein [Frankia sp. R43]KPM54192.1 hypothetical protein ACG83_19505 [Frankia sp. R43]